MLIISASPPPVHVSVTPDRNTIACRCRRRSPRCSLRLHPGRDDAAEHRQRHRCANCCSLFPTLPVAYKSKPARALRAGVRRAPRDCGCRAPSDFVADADFFSGSADRRDADRVADPRPQHFCPCRSRLDRAAHNPPLVMQGGIGQSTSLAWLYDATAMNMSLAFQTRDLIIAESWPRGCDMVEALSTNASGMARQIFRAGPSRAARVAPMRIAQHWPAALTTRGPVRRADVARVDTRPAGRPRRLERALI